MKKKYSKRYKKLADTLKASETNTIEDAIKKVKANWTTKFNECLMF